MASLQFVVVSGPDKGTRMELVPGAGQVLGRFQEATYRLNDPRVSRTHCEIAFDGDDVYLTDKGSTSGTYINGARVSKSKLVPGDIVRLGETEIRLEIGHLAGATTITGFGKPADEDERATEQLSELTGRVLAHFEIGPVLGKGAQSMVFRAKDSATGKDVALKVMHPSFSQDEEEIQRFVRAMRTTLPLRHPNLVALYGAGKNGPYCWMSMELIDGESLTKVIQRIGVAGMLDWKHAYRVAVHIARALDYASEQKIIHRNISPANILIQSSDKQAKLADLMLARALEGTFAKQITRPGQILGDVNYMAPERTQANAANIDGRSDLFSLGATVYALLTGKPPFAAPSMIDTIRKIRSEEPQRPTKFQMSIPSMFEGVVMRLLAKSPDARYQSAAELLEELERIGRFQGASA